MTMRNSKWYKIKVTPIEGDKPPYEFKIHTSNLVSAMEKYTHDKEGNITSLWEQI